MSLARTLFGPSKDEVWKQLCAEMRGRFTSDSFWEDGKIEVTHGQWSLTLDTYLSSGKTSAPYTRLRAPFINRDDFMFNVYRKGLFSDLGRLLGMQDVKVGYPEFDRDFVIKGNEEQKLRQLFSNAKIRQLLLDQPAIHFSVWDDERNLREGARFPKDVDELYFVVPGVIMDVNRLKELFELFSETLDELCRMGSAYEQSPGVDL